MSKAKNTQNLAKHHLPHFSGSYSMETRASLDEPRSKRERSKPQIPVVDQSCAVTINPQMDLKEAHRQDPALTKLIAFKSANRNRPEFSEWAGDSALRRLWYQYDRLFVRDDLLVRSIKKDSPIPRHTVVVPESLVQEILKGVHDSPFEGHLGVTKTIERIRERFYWPGMRESIESYTRECSVCTQGKNSPNVNKAPQCSIEVGEPFTFWAMDFMGLFPETTQGNRHILVVMEHFTKWYEAIPTKDQSKALCANL